MFLFLILYYCLVWIKLINSENILSELILINNINKGLCKNITSNNIVSLVTYNRNIPDNERNALFDLYQSTNGINWNWKNETIYGLKWNFTNSGN